MTAAVSGDVAHRAFPVAWMARVRPRRRATAPPFGLSRWDHLILRGTPPPRSAPPVTPTAASPAPRSPTPRSPAWPAAAHPATPAANRPSVMPRSAALPWPSTTPVVRSKTTERNSSPSWATLPEPIHGRIRHRPVPLLPHTVRDHVRHLRAGRDHHAWSAGRELSAEHFAPGLNERVQRVTLSEIAGTPRRPSKPPALSPLGAHGRSNAVSSQCRRDRSVSPRSAGSAHHPPGRGLWKPRSSDRTDRG